MQMTYLPSLDNLGATTPKPHLATCVFEGSTMLQKVWYDRQCAVQEHQSTGLRCSRPTPEVATLAIQPSPYRRRGHGAKSLSFALPCCSNRFTQLVSSSCG